MDADLARALVALPGWRWSEGMAVIEAGQSGLRGARGRIVPGTTHDGWSVAWRIDAGTLTTSITHGSLPDLDDPSTGGALLAMLHAAYGPQVAGHPLRVYAYTSHVQVMGGANPHGPTPAFYEDAPTLAHACAAALVAIGRVGYADGGGEG